MKRHTCVKIIIFLLTLLFIFSTGSCNDPIFYTISMEVAPIEPYIKGGAVNYAVFEDRLYTAAGTTLYSYTGNVPTVGSRWNIGFYAKLTVELTALADVTIQKGRYSYTAGGILFNCVVKEDLEVSSGGKKELVFFASSPGELGSALPATGAITDITAIKLIQTPPLPGISLTGVSGSITNAEDGKARIPSPGGRIMHLASINNGTNEYLYALCLTNQNNIGSTTAKVYSRTTGEWTVVGGDKKGYTLRTLFAAEDKVFIGAEKNVGAETDNTSAIFYIDTTNQMQLISGTEHAPASGYDAAVLNGAANVGTNYFLCTNRNIIYKWDGSTVERFTIGNSSFMFMNIINLDGAVVAISRGGALYSVGVPVDEDEDGIIDRYIDYLRISHDDYATGALVISTNKAGKKLLLAGRQGLKYSYNKGYTYGYVELPLSDTGGIIPQSSFDEPGRSSPSTVDDYERYLSTLGKHPVAYIFQAPYEVDEDMRLFASTVKNGVWSYRDRGGEWQWNAETR